MSRSCSAVRSFENIFELNLRVLGTHFEHPFQLFAHTYTSSFHTLRTKLGSSIISFSSKIPIMFIKWLWFNKLIFITCISFLWFLSFYGWKVSDLGCETFLSAHAFVSQYLLLLILAEKQRKSSLTYVNPITSWDHKCLPRQHHPVDPLDSAPFPSKNIETEEIVGTMRNQWKAFQKVFVKHLCGTCKFVVISW